MKLAALHHVTAVCSDAPRTVAFYRDELGMRLVKKTVNFDDPGSYHLYFGDDVGAPGTLLTFFEWPGAEPGRLGHGLVERIGLTVPGTKDVRELEDPDGLRLELHAGERPGLHHVSAYTRADLYVELVDPDAPLRFSEPPDEPGVVGPGVTHHVAWRMRDDDEQLVWRQRLRAEGLNPTNVYDRKYFRSVYFRLPDGLLFELATDGPGFTVDEPRETLGQGLALPDWLEEQRDAIERNLTPV